ncbi:MAG: hypothetical protein AB1420_04350 [Bacillota bacterium]
MKSELKKRQEIGRGLRLPVDQTGNRVFDENINRLTVITNESYEEFALKLQQEITEECGVDFGGRIKNKRERKKLCFKKEILLDENFKALWECIKHKLHNLMINGIKYEKIAGQEYEMMLFEGKRNRKLPQQYSSSQ